ncbi:MAG: ATP-binding protein [Pseudomonadota bacterium]
MPPWPSPARSADVTGAGDVATEAAQDRLYAAELSSTFDCVRQTLAEVMVRLDPKTYGLEERGTVELVLAEVLNNVVEHAYGGREDGVISLAVNQVGGGLWIEVQDTGAPMPTGGFPDESPVTAARDLPSVPEGGYGWFLIGQLAHDPCYRRDGDRNVFSFRLSVG